MKVFLICMVLVSTQNLIGERLSWDQEKELFVKGTITDGDKVWDVRFIPGSSKINQDSLQAQKDALEDLKSYGKKIFWKEEVLEPMKSGVNISKDSVIKYWLHGIGEDFQQTRLENSTIKPGSFGSRIGPSWNWSKFSIKSLGRTITFPIGVIAGGLYSVLAPTYSVVLVPISAGENSFLEGMVLPGVLYVWNGTSWTATFYSNVPEEENFFVRLKTSSGSKEMVIDIKGLQALVERSVYDLKSLEINEKAKTENEPYKAEIQKIENQAQKDRTDVLNKSDETTYNTIVDHWGKKVLNNQAKEIYVDEKELRAFVKSAFEKMGISNPSDEEINHATSLLMTNVEKILKL